MAKMQFDPVDVALSIGLLVSGFIMTGIATFSLFGVDFGAVALTLMGQDLSSAYVLSAVAILGTVVTNDNAELSNLHNDAQRLDEYYYYSILATVGLLVAWLFIPDVGSFFQSGDLWGLVYVAITTTGQFAMGWML